jgi:single-strand DNA-binding protein
MSGINKVILVGNIGKDPEIRYMDGNIAKVRFSLATTEVHKDKVGNRTEHTEWHNIVMWRNMAENAHKLLTKGMQIYLEGKLHTNNWVDKEGNKKSVTEIVAENFVMLQRRENTPNSMRPSFDQTPDNTTENQPY